MSQCEICQLAEQNVDAIFLKVNYEEHKTMCHGLHIHVLPFFRFYRGAEGRFCRFSCTNATLMAPSKTTAKAKAIALRMKAVQMKRCSTMSKPVGEGTTPKQPAKSKKPILGKTKVMKSPSKAANPKKGAATSTNTKDRSNSNQSISKRSVGSKSKKAVVNIKSASGSKHG